MAAGEDHRRGKLKNMFSFEMIRWTHAHQPGGGLWAVISHTCKPLDDSTTWGRWGEEPPPDLPDNHCPNPAAGTEIWKETLPFLERKEWMVGIPAEEPEQSW